MGLLTMRAAATEEPTGGAAAGALAVTSVLEAEEARREAEARLVAHLSARTRTIARKTTAPEATDVVDEAEAAVDEVEVVEEADAGAADLRQVDLDEIDA